MMNFISTIENVKKQVIPKEVLGQRAVEDITWKDVVINNLRVGVQGQKVAEEEFPVELCRGNYGWKLRGSFRTLPGTVIQCEPHKLDSVKKQHEMVVAESSRLQLGEEVQALAKGNCLRGKTTRQEHGQTRRFSKFKLSRRKTGLIGQTNIRSKKSPFTERSTRIQENDRQNQVGMERRTDIEAGKKTGE